MNQIRELLSISLLTGTGVLGACGCSGRPNLFHAMTGESVTLRGTVEAPKGETGSTGKAGGVAEYRRTPATLDPDTWEHLAEVDLIRDLHEQAVDHLRSEDLVHDVTLQAFETMRALGERRAKQPQPAAGPAERD